MKHLPYMCTTTGSAVSNCALLHNLRKCNYELCPHAQPQEVQLLIMSARTISGSAIINYVLTHNLRKCYDKHIRMHDRRKCS